MEGEGGKQKKKKKATVVPYGFFNGYFGDTPRANAQASGEATCASPSSAALA